MPVVLIHLKETVAEAICQKYGILKDQLKDFIIDHMLNCNSSTSANFDPIEQQLQNTIQALHEVTHKKSDLDELEEALEDANTDTETEENFSGPLPELPQEDEENSTDAEDP